jgi:hypothetical protein
LGQNAKKIYFFAPQGVPKAGNALAKSALGPLGGEKIDFLVKKVKKKIFTKVSKYVPNMTILREFWVKTRKKNIFLHPKAYQRGKMP